MQLFYIALTGISLTSSHASPANSNQAIQDFLATQKIIRILADDSPGFGNQAASYSLLNRLRSMGYKGLVQFYYLEEARDKIITLFNLPENLPDNYLDVSRNVELIKINDDVWEDPEQITPHRVKADLKTGLGMTGGLDRSPDSCTTNQSNANENRPFCNYAKIFNVTRFIRFTPYVYHDADINFPYPGYIDTKLYFDNVDQKKLLHDADKFFVVPVPSLNDAKAYLNDNHLGQQVLQQKPALQTLIDGMEKHLFNVLPIYGYTIRKEHRGENEPEYGYFPANILQIITAARYAQLNGPKNYFPLILAVFYDYKEEAKQLMEMIRNDRWPKKYEKEVAGIRQTIKSLNLAQAFFIADISDSKAIEQINTLKSGQILLLSMGSLPKTVFEGIYNHVDSNIWPPIREGANSFNSLILTGKTHFRCRRMPPSFAEKIDVWEMGIEKIEDPNLRSDLTYLYNPNYGFCQVMASWQHEPSLYAKLGGLIINAQDPQSSIAKYFKNLQHQALKPENDRIRNALIAALTNINK